MFTNARYIRDVYNAEKIDVISVEIDGVITSVPMKPANSTYAEIMRQVEAGELIIEPADTNE